jgi:hypothetical protein
MHKEPHTKRLTAIAIGLAVAVIAPIASAKSSPQAKVTIPEWLAHIQYPGTSSHPTVYMAGPVTIPARLARTQFPGTSSQPTVVVDVPASGNANTLKVRNGHIEIPASLARTQYPGTSSEPTVLLNNIQGTGSDGGGFDWVSALIGAGGALGIAAAGAGSLLALRKRRTLVHA